MLVLKIGIPSTLYYYSHFPFWKKFFEELNMEVVCSPVTTKEIVDLGVKETVTDACVPIKIFHGHVMALRNKVDYLFIPRYVSITKDATFCPKFLGLPDMVRHSIDDLPPMLVPRIDIKNSKNGLWKSCRSIAKNFLFSPLKAFFAYRKALKYQKAYEKKLHNQVKPLEYIREEKVVSFNSKTANNSDLKIAVLGYPYEVYDPFISVNVLKKLEDMGVEIATIEMIPKKQLLKKAKKLPKNLFWYYSNQVIRATFHYIEQGITGIIHVTAFGCGPDAMVDKLMELEAKQHQIPFMTLTIDEHSGEAGIQTRLEAFVDMIRLRKEQAV